MNSDLNIALFGLPEISQLKNSTLGSDSGLASSNEVSQSCGDLSISRRLSALSSIPGSVPPVG